LNEYALEVSSPIYVPIRFAQSRVRYCDRFEWHPFDDAIDPRRN